MADGQIVSPAYSQISQNLKRLLHKTKFCDATFLVGTQKMKSHKLILASRSPVFAAMFFSDFVEATSPDIIEIKDVSPLGFSTLLTFIYTDRVSLKSENLLEVLFAAKKYQLDGLIKACMTNLRDDLTTSNCCSFLKSAPAWMDETSVILQYIYENADQVLLLGDVPDLAPELVETILQANELDLEEVDVFKFLLRWAKHEVQKNSKKPANINAAVKALLTSNGFLQHIRFPIITADQLAVTVAPTGLLSVAQINELFRYHGLSEAAEEDASGPEDEDFEAKEGKEENEEKVDGESFTSANSKHRDTIAKLIAPPESKPTKRPWRSVVKKSFNFPYLGSPRPGSSFRTLNLNTRLASIVPKFILSRTAFSQNCVCQDPITGKVYLFSHYTNRDQVLEFPSIRAFISNVRERTITLENRRIGTYHCVMGGFMYYRGFPDTEIVKARVSDGKKVSSTKACLEGVACSFSNSGSFDWGGSSDLCLFPGRGNKLFLLCCASATKQVEILELSTTTLQVKVRYSVPIEKRRTGFAFLCAGVFYFGLRYNHPDIVASYTLSQRKFNDKFRARLPRGSYISQMQWNPSTNVLFYNDARSQLGLANAAVRLVDK
eukprot:CAMPEP_0175126378 /NCGR_PEP_ID=MMETSP0087-20121206/3816_1 /TAXON_ID=136419 /ORGANISM="Unknown Unknown, Strain D1" /LENGTH=605 /DNA_ID=CAMNT_0016408275 /DNA_START=42 /DNA_END=1859 /DNA_ORIENTATION=+